MSEATSAFPRAFAVWFKDFDRWDPMSFHGIHWHWPPEVMKPIGSVLKIRKTKVDRGIFSFGSLQPITIHFDGSIEKREVDPNREYSMDLYFARPGDIVVAKIDLKNGAVGIVPDIWKNVVVTGHFAVYEPDRSKLLPEYLHLIIQTSFFKAHLWRNKVGAEGRKEVKLDFFEAEKIPLPAISIQKAIVERWNHSQDEIAAVQKRVEGLKTEIDAQYFRDLGLTPPIQIALPKVFAVMWKEFLRWGVNYNQKAQTGVDISKGKYPVIELGSILDMVQYGTSEKANENDEGTPILRISNIKDRFLDVTNLKYIELPKPTKESLLLKDGDILIIRTSGSRNLVGTCAVYHENSEYVFASYLIRLRVNYSKADPDFISWFINSPFGRQQVDAISRQIMQNNLNSEEISNFQVPHPPLEIQREIMLRISTGIAQITRERRAAEQRSREIRAEVEALILGTKKLEGYTSYA